MRHITSGSATLTVAMYHDHATRTAMWGKAVQTAVDDATSRGLTVLQPGSYFASATFYRHDPTTGAHLVCDPSSAHYVRITAEITCEDTHAQNR